MSSGNRIKWTSNSSKEGGIKFSGLLQLLIISVMSLQARRVVGQTFTLPSNCITKCGSISIPYPFGIGKGCFRSGLDLTCDDSSSPPKLFLGNSNIEVSGPIDMESSHILVNSKIATMNATGNSYNSSLMNLSNRPYRLFSVASEGGSIIQSPNNYLYTAGCSSSTNLIDLNKNTVAGNCSTICANATIEAYFDTPCNITSGCCRCCTLDLPSSLLNIGVEITRQYTDAGNNIANPTSIYVFMSNQVYSTFKDITVINESSISQVTLSWYIDDQPSCEEGLKHEETYACLSSNSYCYNVYPNLESQSAEALGYICMCPEGYIGNPYIPNGCQGLPINSLIPNSNCTSKCGDVDILFPFGTEKGCYRDQTFALTCNDTSNGQTLYYKSTFVVTNISLEEGNLETSLTTASGSGSHVVFVKEQDLISWVIDHQSCASSIHNRSTYACLSDQSICIDANITDDYGYQHPGYRCKCQNGYEGNPYIPNGCTDIDECQLPNDYICYGSCVNTEGRYSCTCPEGTHGNATRGPCTPDKGKNILLGIVIGISIGVGLIIVSVAFIFTKQRCKKRNKKVMREKFFEQNHGLLLEQLICSSESTNERTKIFSLEDLEKATNNFDDSRIVGHGGHGTVYKGILSDQRVVAIKKSKIKMKKEIDQFINEVAILSQINHRNVVKIFGCCLETEVPLLVYEFITNGTLYEHLHTSKYDSILPWEDRLRIAIETAGALAYLHSAASVSIFHRDIKSSNILLDEYYTAKISDFGASRFIPFHQTHIVTGIQGTYGYLDPEYYQTGQLTEKSDVYSFGVILLELLTGRKPITSMQEEDIHLPMQVLQAMRENRLLDLIDDNIRTEVTKDEIAIIIKLAESCLKLKGDKRPTMKEVEITLQSLRKRRSNRNEQHDEETENLLSQSSYKLHRQHNSYEILQQETRNYTFEMEMMSSIKHPR